LLRKLVEMHYTRNDLDFHRGVFRVRGDRVEIFPAYEESLAVRVEFFGDEIEGIAEIDPLKGSVVRSLKSAVIFPASHYATEKARMERACKTIVTELAERVDYFRAEGKLIEAQRIEERTRFDLEMILELGYCNGIENYSRHITGRKPGEPPPTLLDYFPDRFLVFIDESHIAIPQLNAMYRGDRSRKETLVEYGFRLPSALDNRPLRFEEFTERIGQVVYVSATPAEYELSTGGDALVEQIVRPTGLVDPEIEVRDVNTQVDDLYHEIRRRVELDERVLVTTLTKRTAEDLTEYYADLGLRVRYLHSDIVTLERMEIIRELRMGTFDVLIGINLLREGLDIPEVSLVAVLDADKEGFLRSTRSLIQTCGRASRNVNGKVILYAETVTRSMARAIEETNRRRKIQLTHNRDHGIRPRTIQKEINRIFDFSEAAGKIRTGRVAETVATYGELADPQKAVRELEARMHKAAELLEFERAAELRDRIREIKTQATR
jgi:excinuclease ABC subunit B